nr:MAG TPA: hypothetical protein [Caudoviricetes sp.]
MKIKNKLSNFLFISFLPLSLITYIILGLIY